MTGSHGYLGFSPPIAFAHRGGAAVPANIGVENTLAAFEHAVGLGYRHLETDVHCSADGVPYACHDPSLERLVGAPVRLGDLSSDEVDALLVGGREPFVRLDQLVRAFPDATFNIDVKARDAVEATCAVIEAEDAVDRTCLASFDHPVLRAIRRRLPRVATSASRLEIALVKFLPAFLLGLVRQPGARFLQVPVTRGRIRVVTPRFIRRAHALGLQVHVWTIDDEAEMIALLDLGVDGIFTDRTDILKDVLISRADGAWHD